MIHIFDELHCQTLKVSGAGNIDNVEDVTSRLLGNLASFSLSKAAGAEDVVTVTINPLNALGETMLGVRNVHVWLSDASTGAGAASTMAVDSIAATTGTILVSLTANADLICQTNSSGVLTLSLTDDVVGASSVGYVCVENPFSGEITTIQIETGDYGVA